jgi:hypothetical protein
VCMMDGDKEAGEEAESDESYDDGNVLTWLG